MAQVNASLLKPIGVFSGLAGIIVLPMLLPGYILTLDMVFTPKLRMPTQVSSSYLFHGLLHVLNIILPSQIIEKVVLFGIIVMSGIGMYILLKYLQSDIAHTEYDTWGCYFAGVLFAVNPYTYSRFMAGQYAVLLGYATLPFFFRTSCSFFALPTMRRALHMVKWAIIISIVSIHTIGLAAIVAITQCIAVLWKNGLKRTPQVVSIIKLGTAGLIVCLLASSYWLIPLLHSSNTQGRAITSFSHTDQQAFATVGKGAIERIGNVLELRGFWAEDRGLYLLPQNLLPGWQFIMLCIWALACLGAYSLWKHGQRTTVYVLAAISVITITLAATSLISWLSSYFSLLKGYREPDKYVGLLAMCYAICAGAGLVVLFNWLQKRQSQALFTSSLLLVLLLPVIYTPPMFWGFAGQLRSRQYPADWYAVNTFLNSKHDDEKVLFLPWHLYMSFDFAGRIIANPAQDFFDKPTLTSNELEFKDASPTAPDSLKTEITHSTLPGAERKTHLGKQLRNLQIGYVLLAKEYDYQKYHYLDRQVDLSPIRETPHLKLYEVTAQ